MHYLQSEKERCKMLKASHLIMSSLLVSILLNVVSIKAETVNASMTKVTLVVEGMMKSKGGVT